MNTGARVLGKDVVEEWGEPGAVPVDDRPRSAYEMVTRTMLVELREDVGEVKGRVNTLLWLVVGASLIDVLMRIAG